MKRRYLPEKFNMENMKKVFDESYEILSEVNEAFHIKMEKIYKKKNMDIDKFCDCTNLHKNFIRSFYARGIYREWTHSFLCVWDLVLIWRLQNLC